VADKKGNTYALVAHLYTYEYEPVYINHYLYKLNSSGDRIRTFDLGNLSQDYYGVGIADVAVDGTGNIYAINRQTVSNSPKDVIKKLYASGSQHWQRLSPVGTPYGITVTAAGNVYVIGSTGMARLSNAGALTWTKTGTSYAVSEFSQRDRKVVLG